MTWLWRLLFEEHGWGKIWTGLAMAITLAGGGLVYQQVIRPNQSTPGQANVWVDQSGGTCSRSATLISYTDSGACATLAASYAAAQSGDQIEIRGGSYDGVEQLEGSKTIEMRVTTGETATIVSPLRFLNIENLTMRGPFDMNSVDCCWTPPATESGAYGFRLQGCNKNDAFYNLSGHHFSIGGSSDGILMSGGTWGNYGGGSAYESMGERPFSSDTTISGFYGKTTLDHSAAAGCATQEAAWGADGILRNITLDGLTFQYCNYGDASGGGHPDCLESSGADEHITIKNSVFRYCGNTCIGWYTDWWNHFDVTVQNNLFQYVWASSSGIQMGDRNGALLGFYAGSQGQTSGCSDMVFRYNTYIMDDPGHDNPSGDDEYAFPGAIGCGGAYGGGNQTTQIYGNIIEGGPAGGTWPSGCAGWTYNMFIHGTACGTGSFTNGSPDFIDTTNYKLGASSPALAAGDPSRFPATDYEGTARTSVPDIGRDER